MSLKVGQAQQAGAAAATRAATALHATPATGVRQVDSLWGTSPSGREDESFRFTDSWDDMQKRRSPRRARLGLHPESVRFGDVLASESIGSMMLSFRAQDLAGVPSLRFGAMIYERSKAAIITGGHLRTLGEQVNRYL